MQSRSMLILFKELPSIFTETNYKGGGSGRKEKSWRSMCFVVAIYIGLMQKANKYSTVG